MLCEPLFADGSGDPYDTPGTVGGEKGDNQVG